MQALYSHLRLVTAAAAKRQAEASGDRQAIESKQKTVSRHIENLRAAVRDFGHSRVLLVELAGLEAELDRLEAAMAASSAKPIEDVSEAEVRMFLKDAMERVGDILLGNPEKIRHELQKRVSSVTLTSGRDESGVFYKASGDVELFSRPDGAVQNDQGELAALQYTLPVSIEVRKASRQKAYLEKLAA